mgnify:CR=1 FL=1
MMSAMRLVDRMLPILSAHFDKRLVFESNQLIEIFCSFYSFHIISLFFDYIFAAKILFFRLDHPRTFLLSPYLGISRKPSFLGIADYEKRK